MVSKLLESTGGSSGSPSPSKIVTIEPWKRKLQTNSRGNLAPSSHNLGIIFANDVGWKDILLYDAFADEIATDKPPPWAEYLRPTDFKAGILTESDFRRAQMWLCEKYEIDPSISDIYGVLQVLAERKRQHPVRDFFETLKWDRRKRLDKLFVTYGGATDSRYVREVGKNFLIGAVARIYKPGCQVDTMPILEGGQGIGKTTFIKILGGEWYLSAHIDLDNKDAYEVLRRKWLAEWGELDAASRAEVGKVKLFVTQSTDTYRRPFAKRATDNPRQCVFIGTLNPEGAGEYLKDNTGARRFQPVRFGVTGKVRLKELARDRDQIIAEAITRFKQGEPWHIEDTVMLKEAASQAEDRRQRDPWEAFVAGWLATSRGGARNRAAGVTTEEVLQLCFQMEPVKITKGDSMRVAGALRMNGWHAGEARERRGGVVCRVFRPTDA